MTTDELYDAAREATPWVVNGLLVRGGVTDFVGAAKESGKTTFITHMVGHVTDGLTFINRAVERSRVLYLTEMAADNFRDYLQQAGVRRGDDLRTVFKRDVWELGWEELIEAVGEQCTAEGRGVLVVDTFAEFSGITGTEENNAGDIHKKMTVLRKVSQVHDLAVLLVRHANKEGKGRGSSAFEASVDILMLYKRPQSQDSETTVRTLEGLGRWTESNFKTNVDLKAGGFENIGNDKHIEFNRAARGILAAAGVGEENAKDRASLTKELQTSRTTTDRALDWLVEHGSLVRVGEGVKGNPYKFFIPPKDFSPHAPGPIRGARGKKNSEPKEIPANEHISEDADSSHAPNNSAVAGELVDTDEGAAGCIEWLESVPSVALDIETYGKTKADGTSYLKGTVRLLTFHHGGETRVVDLHAVSNERAAEMLRAIGDKPKYIHNALFDLPRLYRRTGVLLKDHVFDTMLASRTARAGETEWTGAKKSHDLGAVLNRELGIPINKEIDHKWGKPLTPERLEYAVNDVLYLEELHGALARLLDKHGVSDRYDAIRATLPTFLEAAVRGVPVNRQRLEELSTSALAERDQLREALDAMAPEHPEGGTWTWNTSKNTGTEGPGRNGALRTLEVAGVKLDNLQDQTLLDRRDEHPLVAALQDYRKKAQEYSKYRKWIPEFYEDGRIYPQPKVAGAVTSRLLYSDPNIQGVEKHKTKEYRKVISPGAGMSIVTGDFAQQELRIAALISGDEEMLRPFANGEDIYLKTASKMVGYQITDKEHPARAGAKRATLGFLYGLGIDKYRENTYKDYGIALSREQANKDREAFRAAFPRFHAWQQEYGARADRETRSVLGWRRVVGLGKDNNGNPVPKYTDRLNGPIQSTAGDILYLTLAKMQEDWAAGMHPDAKFLMGVHDEIVLECPEESAKDAALWLKGKMREAFEEVLGPELGGPKSVDVGYGPS